MHGPRFEPDGRKRGRLRRCWSCDELLTPRAVTCRYCGADVSGREAAALSDRLEQAAHGHPSAPRFSAAPEEPVQPSFDYSRDYPGAGRSSPGLAWSDDDFARISQSAGQLARRSTKRQPEPEPERESPPARSPDPEPESSAAAAFAGRAFGDRFVVPSRPQALHNRAKWVIAASVALAVAGTAVWAIDAWNGDSSLRPVTAFFGPASDRSGGVEAPVRPMTAAPGSSVSVAPTAPEAVAPGGQSVPELDVAVVVPNEPELADMPELDERMRRAQQVADLLEKAESEDGRAAR